MTIPHAFAEPAERPTPVILHPHPFSSETRQMTVHEGATIGEIVGVSGIPEQYWGFVRVWVDDVEVPRDAWLRVRPKVGRHVYVKITPQGGGGSGKNVLASILMLIVTIGAAIFAPMIAGALFPALTGAGLKIATGLIGAGISMVGALLVSALIPPPQQGDGLASQLALLSGVRNQFAPYADIPRIFGKRRVYPLQAARPYTEAQGTKRYLRVLLCAGFGPLQITNIKIGETPILNYQNIEVQTREGWAPAHLAFGNFPAGKSVDTPQTLFTKSVQEDSFAALLDHNPDGSGPGPWVTRRTEDDTSEVSLDITFPFGLARFNDKGNTEETTVLVDVQYRKVGTVTWLPAVWSGPDVDDGTNTNGQLTGTDKSRTPTIRGGRIVLPEAGQYDVRLRRATEQLLPEKKYAQRVDWTTLRSIKYENPIAMDGLALIALRMQATDQFNGLPDTINCEVQSYLPAFNGSTWTWALTSNPAWAYADVMRRRGTEGIILDSRIDLAGIRSWALACAANAPNGDPDYWRFDGIFERGGIFTALKQIAAHGRASFTIRDGKYSVVRDVAQTVPIQHITPRNSWGYSGQKAFVDLPHALKIKFVNAAEGFQEDEVIVYDDGRNESNSTKFEALDLPGCTSAAQAWREGRYYLAVGQLRPEEHQVSMDIEALRCTLGDYVLLAHDVLSVGLGSGRILQRLTNGSQVTGYVLDQEVPYRSGRSHVLRVRLATGDSLLYSLAVVQGSANVSTVSLLAPIPLSGAADEGDLFIFGLADRESAPMIVKRIEPSNDLVARVTLVDAQPGVWTADTAAIPNFRTYITDQTPVPQKAPPVPTFTLVSDESVVIRLADGTLQDRIGVTINPLSGGNVDVAGFDVQWRPTLEAEYRQALASSTNIRNVFIAPVEQGVAYDVRVRSVSRFGINSDWRTITGHVVIGKTTPPSAVTGFTVTGGVDGFQLSWEDNPEVDVIGYRVRRGASWSQSVQVTALATGTSFFVQGNSAAAQTFHIRAVDAIGLLSEATTSATGTLAPPANVTRFEVYPQEDYIRAAWDVVAGTGVEYEVRNGDSWATARVVGRSAGNTMTVKWPTRTGGSPIFLIRARSSAGIYSPTAYLTSVAQIPIPNRNIILDVDYAATTWPGVRHDMTAVGSGAGSTLKVDLAPDGLTYGSAEYTHKVTLPANYYARNWLEYALVASGGGGVTWAAASFSWEAAGSATTWLGEVDPETQAEASAYIAIGGITSGAEVVEGWQLDGSLVGAKGTTPSTSTGASYQDCHYTDGLLVDPTVRVGWTVSVPSTFTQMFDFRPTAAMTNDCTLLTLINGANRLALSYIAATDTFVLEDHLGRSVDLQVPNDVGDVITFCITQSVTTRALYAFTRRHPTVLSASATFAPPGNYTQLALYAA